MSKVSIDTTEGQKPASPSFFERWTDVFVDPGDVFEALKSAPVSWLNWLLPLLLTTLLAVIFHGGDIGQRVAQATVTTEENVAMQKLNGLAMMGLANALGLFWSALLLWLMGRVIFKATFSFMKAMEVAGLASLVLALGMVVTHLLVAASGDADARPALSLFIEKFDATNRFHVALGTANFMHVWLAGVLASGLAKLSNVRFGDAAFWVFGYWIGLRVMLALLGAGAVVL